MFYCFIPLAVGDLVWGLLSPPMLEFLGSPFPSEGTLCGVLGEMAESRGRRPRTQHSVKEKVSRSFYGAGGEGVAGLREAKLPTTLLRSRNRPLLPACSARLSYRCGP